MATDALVAYRPEDFANIRDSRGVAIRFLATRTITGLPAANTDHATDFGFRPTIFNWMFGSPFSSAGNGHLLSGYFLEQMFSCDGDELHAVVQPSS